jgi:hypothetical protein
MGAVVGSGKNFTCKICGAVFETTEQLLMHERLHHRIP